ncbi:MAG TPA: hypothetical protein VKD47_04205 [Miltoncostaeaceae bacterium]|nr:hypothetical protein [Miltoncostaeaceae bacterium]
MTERALDRCIAIAAHGRRCQQTRFRGSPYCWHHLQSRKVFAPSRPRSVARPRPIDDNGPVPAAPDRMAIAVRLAAGLGLAELTALVDFLEDRRDGTITLLKDGGVVVDVALGRGPVRARAAEIRILP